MKRLVLFAFFFAIFPESMAYIDPGTGSLIISSAWSYILGLLSIISGFVLLRIISPMKKWIKNEKK